MNENWDRWNDDWDDDLGEWKFTLEGCTCAEVEAPIHEHADGRERQDCTYCDCEGEWV
jgi:hypothetical protein